MKLLIVSATEQEISPLLLSGNLCEGINEKNGHEIRVLLTGAGMVATAFAMGAVLAEQSFDLAINLGIAGSFDRTLAIGTVVQVAADRFSELGAEDGPGFIRIDELGFGRQEHYPFGSTTALHLPAVSAITVNTVHGHAPTIEKTQSRVAAQIESMEGAAFFYCCERSRTPSVQVRALSNYVERRNRESWNIALAVQNLNTFALDFINPIIR